MVSMRTSTTAVSAVTSTTPLLPQSHLSGKSKPNRDEESRCSIGDDADLSRISRYPKARISTASMFPIYTANMLAALSHLSDGMSSSITAVVTSGDPRDVRS